MSESRAVLWERCLWSGLLVALLVCDGSNHVVTVVCIIGGLYLSIVGLIGIIRVLHE